MNPRHRSHTQKMCVLKRWASVEHGERRRADHSRWMKEFWASPKGKAKKVAMIAKNNQHWSDPDLRREHRERALDYWTPERREAWSARMSDMRMDPVEGAPWRKGNE